MGLGEFVAQGVKLGGRRRPTVLSTVACRLYEKTNLSDVQIARITGHKDLRMLRRYASLRGSDLAAALW